MRRTPNKLRFSSHELKNSVGKSNILLPIQTQRIANIPFPTFFASVSQYAVALSQIGTMLAYRFAMKTNLNNSASQIWRGLFGSLICAFLALTIYSQSHQEKPPENQTTAEFMNRVQQYVKLREQLDRKIQKPSGKSEPEQIKDYQAVLEEGLRTARAGAKQEDIFTPSMATHIRNIIKQEFKGKRLKKLRADVAKAQTKGVPLRVNYSYPEQKELYEMPPTLLLKLPTLPKQLRYRFVGENMLLVDTDALLIVDYVMDVIP